METQISKLFLIQYAFLCYLHFGGCSGKLEHTHQKPLNTCRCDSHTRVCGLYPPPWLTQQHLTLTMCVPLGGMKGLLVSWCRTFEVHCFLWDGKVEVTIGAESKARARTWEHDNTTHKEIVLLWATYKIGESWNEATGARHLYTPTIIPMLSDIWPCNSANPFMGTLEVPVTNWSSLALISLSKFSTACIGKLAVSVTVLCWNWSSFCFQCANRTIYLPSRTR